MAGLSAIRRIGPCLLCALSAAGEYTAALWRMPRDRYSNNYLEQAAQLPATKAPVKRQVIASPAESSRAQRLRSL